MSVIITQTGTFNLSGETSITPDLLNDITDLFGGTSIAEDALTGFNCFTSILAIALILFDNRRRHKIWKIAPSNRIPLGLALVICISHIIFIMKEYIGLESFEDFNPPENERLACKVLNELGFLCRPPLLHTDDKQYGFLSSQSSHG